MMKTALLMALVTTLSVSCPKSDSCLSGDKKEPTIAQEYALANTATIDIVEAIEIAKKTAPGAKIVELELEKEKDSLVWEVEYFSKKEKYEMYINAKTGKIEKNEKEKD